MFTTLVAALRDYMVGSDTLTYVNLYKPLANLLAGSYDFNIQNIINSRFELGYIYYDRFLYAVSENPRLLIGISSAIIYFAIFWYICKFSRNVSLSTFIFLTFGMFASSLSVLRQFLALVFILRAFDVLEKNKYLKFAVFVFLGFLFHKTAIIFMIMVLIKNKRFNSKNLTMMFGLTLLTILFYNRIFSQIASNIGSYDTYVVTSQGQAIIAPLLNALLIASIIIFCYLCKKNTSLDDYNKIFRDNEWNQLMLMLVISLCISIVAMKFNQLSRISAYFDFAYLILLPNSLLLLKNKSLKYIVTTGTIILGYSYFLIIQILRPEWSGIVPYHSFI
ncbi:EpsG family protein [Pediococcus inopinatus]|uniref:EpsG family protein n=1 Tax=Pediococcus inopinatus TaxID=114090 RepID=UPI002B2610D1|nr:EpsG family protein [Pediococcus inopinatus]WPC18764.1 EpsG family protein [Pediococcus inopinatus]